MNSKLQVDCDDSNRLFLTDEGIQTGVRFLNYVVNMVVPGKVVRNHHTQHLYFNFPLVCQKYRLDRWARDRT